MSESLFHEAALVPLEKYLTSVIQLHVNRVALLPVETATVCVPQVEGVGLYFRQQLLQSRHRGTFELAYVGFVRFTDMLCRYVCVRVGGISVRTKG